MYIPQSKIIHQVALALVLIFAGNYNESFRRSVAPSLLPQECDKCVKTYDVKRKSVRYRGLGFTPYDFIRKLLVLSHQFSVVSSRLSSANDCSACLDVGTKSTP